MDTIFTVRNEDLGRLTPEQAVDLFRELLWAEATSCGVGKNLIDVPSAITVRDGGIDAEVQGAQPQGGQGIIKQGITRYQIKTGDFSLGGEAHIRDILFREDTKKLKPRVKSCLDAGGTLVVVLFGWDNPETQDDQIRQRFIAQLQTIDEKYATARIEIWRQNNLRGFLSRFPSLSLRVTGRDKNHFQSHSSWSRHDDMLKEFKEGDAQHEVMQRLQLELRKQVAAVHVRIWGEPGVGKTRLVLEATRAEDLAPLVVYCDSASRFLDSDLMNELLREDNSFSVILVIDECDPDSRSSMWNKLKHRGPRIKLVSIYGEYDPTSGDIVYSEAPPLDKEQIVNILETYEIPKDQAGRWSELCGGSPRVAHVLGSNLKNNPEDLLKPPDTVNVWERYIQAGDPPNSEAVHQRRLVLRYLSLFKRFGYGKPLATEGQAVATLVEQDNPGITWPRFQAIIATLRQRKILQGETTLYVTPKAFHIKLWLDWWETYGQSFDFQKFENGLPPQLLEWFMEMFQYAAGSPASAKVVSDLLGPQGPFQREGFLRSPAGAHFFIKLSEADPKAALSYLKSTLGTWGKEKLLEFTDGRREVVWSLEKIAVWKDLFRDAALLLLALGEAENEHGISNNASGVFTSLFAVGPGPVASTEASAEERLLLLRDALSSGSSEKRKLALMACGVMLQSRQWFRVAGPENQGIRRGAKLWVPKTYGEWYDAYRQAWKLLTEALERLPEDERVLALETLLGRLRGLTTIPDLVEMVIATIRDLAGKDYVDKKKVLGHVVQVLHYEGKTLPEETRKKWEEIRDELTGSDFGALMRRYVAMDLLEDKFDEHGNQVDQAQPRIEELARKAAGNSELLEPEYHWLVTGEAENGFRFGYEVGKLDPGLRLLPRLLEVQKVAGLNASLYFIGGYFRAFREKDEQGWEQQLDALTSDVQAKTWVAELTWRSGLLSDRAANRILDLAQSGAIAIGHFRMFVFGGVIRGLSQHAFEQWISYLLDSSEQVAIQIAVDLYLMYYKDRVPRTPLPTELTLRLLAHQTLFQSGPIGRFHNEVFDWTAIGKGFLRDHPAESLLLAEKILQHLGEDGTIVEGFHSEARTLLNDIAQRFPSEVWALVTRFLGPPIDARAYHIKDWLRGDDAFRPEAGGMLAIFPLDKVWEWVDGDLDKRAWYLATLISPSLFREEGKSCLARELLIRHGDREDVRRELMANFSTEGWMGPESAHLRHKRDELLDFVQDEPNERVKRWIDEYVSYLNADIRRAEIREERES